MLINSLSLKNFKCFEELDVKFAPITLLTGANSSGKSSLINAILAVLQTEQFPFYLSPNGKYINMGSFEEMAFSKKPDSIVDVNISFINTWNIISNNTENFIHNDSLNYRDLLSFLKNSNYLDINDFINTYDTKWEVNKINDLSEIHYANIKERDLELQIIKDNNYSFKITFDSIWLDSNYYEYFVNMKKGTVKELGDKIEVSAFGFKSIDEINSMFKELFDYRFADIYLDLSNVDNSFNYIGSFRLTPERTYYQKSKSEAKILNAGEGYIDQIIEWEEKGDEKFDKLVSIINDLGLISDIKTSRLKGGRFELSIRTKNNADYSSLVDVGFGVSQFLPILVADLQLHSGSCLAISQPEIHLHPQIQATYGNYLSNQINNNLKQYIVETHSEYLLNRIRLLLVNGELKPEDVCVLYFENDGLKSTVHNVEFATDGQIKGAPQGFFDTYGIDVMNIAMSAIA